MEKVIEWLKKPFVVIGAVFGILLLWLKFTRDKNKDLKSQVLQGEALKTDAVLSQQQKDLAAENAAEIARLEAEKGRKLSQEEMTDFLKKL